MKCTEHFTTPESCLLSL